MNPLSERVLRPSESPAERVGSILCGIPIEIRSRRFLAMLKFYVDDSGSDPDPQGHFILAGYVMEEPRWVDFASKWYAQLKRDFPVDYSRMADAEGGTGPYQGISSIYRKRKVQDLAEVIRDCRPTALSCIMSWKDYIAHIKGQVNPDLDNPYSVLFFKIMMMNTELQKRFNESIPDEIKAKEGIAIKPVDFIFDDQGPAGLKCLQWYSELRDRVAEPDRTVIANTPQFKNDRDLNPLQAADMLAWHVRRAYSHPQEDRRAIFDLLAPAGLWQYEVSSDELANIAYAFKTRVKIT
jgi:hypothetical protein